MISCTLLYFPSLPLALLICVSRKWPPICSIVSLLVSFFDYWCFETSQEQWGLGFFFLQTFSLAMANHWNTALGLQVGGVCLVQQIFPPFVLYLLKICSWGFGPDPQEQRGLQKKRKSTLICCPSSIRLSVQALGYDSSKLFLFIYIAPWPLPPSKSLQSDIRWRETGKRLGKWYKGKKHAVERSNTLLSLTA